LLAAQGSTRKHALDRLLDDALGELALEDRFGRAFLDAADIACVVVIDLVVALLAGEHHLVRVDDDHVVAVVDVGGEARLVLAAQAHGDKTREAPDDEALSVDEKPLLLDLGRFGRMRLAEHEGFRTSGSGLLAAPTTICQRPMTGYTLKSGSPSSAVS